MNLLSRLPTPLPCQAWRKHSEIFCFRQLGISGSVGSDPESDSQPSHRYWWKETSCWGKEIFEGVLTLRLSTAHWVESIKNRRVRSLK